MTLYLVGCGKSKRPVRSPARDLYTGQLVTKSLRYAEREAAASGSAVLILSALHGAVELDQVLGPYDLSMRDLQTEERRAWGERVADTLRQRGGGNARLVVLAGVAYADPLRPHFDRIEEPMGGLGLGHRQRWLNLNTRPTSADVETPC